MSSTQDDKDQQLLHLVFGGEVETPTSHTFVDVENLDIVGIYPSNAEAENAWRAKAQSTVDNATMRYFVVHMHRLLDPDSDEAEG
ncbi:MAG: DUF4170 domain-containing protein [Hyphomicrobiales bacterium]